VTYVFEQYLFIGWFRRQFLDIGSQPSFNGLPQICTQVWCEVMP